MKFGRHFRRLKYPDGRRQNIIQCYDQIFRRDGRFGGKGCNLAKRVNPRVRTSRSPAAEHFFAVTRSMAEANAPWMVAASGWTCQPK